VRTCNGNSAAQLTRSFSSSPVVLTRFGPKKKVPSDAYIKAQRKRFEAALELRRQRRKPPPELSESIFGKATPFLDSLDTPTPLTAIDSSSSQPPLNYGLKPDEIKAQFELSQFLLSPTKQLPVSIDGKESDASDAFGASELEGNDSTIAREAAVKHATAEEAIKRITDLEHGSSSDRLHWNINRCIEAFGRHNTDQVLPVGTGHGPKATPRIGKDTGSSEVQIAILTARIRSLGMNLRNKDKRNKRSLRTMVHKRQKLLRYLHRRERGGPRWKNLVDTLGLTDASWKGQICM
jgi:ribosomal protein S15